MKTDIDAARASIERARRWKCDDGDIDVLTQLADDFADLRAVAIRLDFWIGTRTIRTMCSSAPRAAEFAKRVMALRDTLDFSEDDDAEG